MPGVRRKGRLGKQSQHLFPGWVKAQGVAATVKESQDTCLSFLSHSLGLQGLCFSKAQIQGESASAEQALWGLSRGAHTILRLIANYRVAEEQLSIPKDQLKGLHRNVRCAQSHLVKGVAQTFQARDLYPASQGQSPKC